MRASTIVLTCLSVSGVASAMWLGLQLSEERARSDALSADLRAMRRLSAPQSGVTNIALPSSNAPPAQPAAGVPPPKVAAQLDASLNAEPPGARARDFNEARRQLLGNPEYRKAMRMQQRMMIEQRYRDLPRALGLSPDKASQVFDQLADDMMQNFDGRERRLSVQNNGSQVWVDQQRGREESAMAKLLGADGMQKFQDFRESQQSRSEVRMLGAELVGSPDPLREDQMEPLFNVMYAEQKRLQQEWNELTMSGVDGSKLGAKRSEAAIAANERIVDSARSLLSGTQLAALQEMYRRQKAQMESQDEMNRLMMEAMPKATPGRTD
jgi:hypothetical protein